MSVPQELTPEAKEPILVTGASGFIGYPLTAYLLEKGYKIHVLLRNSKSLDGISHPNLIRFSGDILDRSSLGKAMAGCSAVFHAAASTSTNPAHESDVMRTNVEGTSLMMETALKEGVKKFIFTSTASVLGSSETTPLTEKSIRNEKFLLPYERSKSMAENILLSKTGKNLQVVIIRPTKVFGPGHTRNAYTADQVILQYMKRKWIVIPGNPVMINFAFIRDVVRGHYLALLHGKDGENYLLGGENKTYFEFFNSIRALQGSGKILRAPHSLFHLWGVLSEGWQKISGNRALITRQTADFLFSNHAFSSEKAIKELGYSITPFEDAMHITVAYLQKNK